MVVCHCYRRNESIIQIICARKDSCHEAAYYRSEIMRYEYDFLKVTKNPYASQLKKQITIRLDEERINYFKSISEIIGIPYQSLSNLYLRDCTASNRKLDLKLK